MPVYKLFVPSQAVGASLVYFDLFNASGNGRPLQVLSVVPIVSGAVLVTGTVGVDLFLTRTSAVGTGGTVATYEGTSLTAATISAIDNNQPLFGTSEISARLTPSGGATAASVISWRSVYTEEANSATYTQVGDMVRYWNAADPGLVVPKNTGIRVVQGSVASVGNIGFDVLFQIGGRG